MTDRDGSSSKLDLDTNESMATAVATALSCPGVTKEMATNLALLFALGYRAGLAAG